MSIIKPPQIPRMGHQIFVLEEKSLIIVALDCHGKLLEMARMPTLIHMGIDLFTRWDLGYQHRSQVRCVQLRLHAGVAPLEIVKKFPEPAPTNILFVCEECMVVNDPTESK